MSGTTNTIHMLFTNCVTHNKYITNTYMSFENSVTYSKCDHNIHMLFKKLNNISKKLIDIDMLLHKNICRIRNYMSFNLFEKFMSYKKIICRLSFSNVIICRMILRNICILLKFSDATGEAQAAERNEIGKS